jgi:MFS family permease
MDRPRLWTKDFIIITAVNLFFSLNFYLLMVFIPVYAMDSFQASTGEAGLAASVFVLGGILPRLFFGRWIEVIGRKRTLCIGLAAGLAVTLSYFVTNSLTSLIVIRLLHGAAFGIATTGAVTIAANIIPVERRGEGLAYHMSLSSTLSAAVGPLLSMILIQRGNFDLIFWVCTVFVGLSLVGALIAAVPEIKLTREQTAEVKGFSISRFFEAAAIPISIICGLIYLSYSSVLTFLSPYSEEINMTGIASFFFVILSVAILVSRPFVGRLFDVKGENIVMYPAILIFGAGALALSQTYHSFTLALAAILIGLGLGTIQSSCQTIVIKVVPPHHTGLATSTFLLFIDIAVGTGPVIFGFVVPLAGYRGAYTGVAIMALVCLFLYYFLHGRKVSAASGVKEK